MCYSRAFGFYFFLEDSGNPLSRRMRWKMYLCIKCRDHIGDVFVKERMCTSYGKEEHGREFERDD